MLEVKSYDLDLNLSPGDTYEGKVQIKINLKEEGSVFVDFYG
jgi:hypothetical protein